MTTIAVTAVSGQLGSEIVKATIEVVGKENVVGLARTPSKAKSLGIEIRPGDYGSPSGLATSLHGVDVVLLVSGMDAPDKRVSQHRSITIQLLRTLTDMAIIATASRPETQDWVRKNGAHHAINHREPMAPQIEALGVGAPGFVFSTTHSGDRLEDIVELMAPQGRFGLIDDPDRLDVGKLKQKAISLHWEFMFARPLFGTPDIAEQSKLLNEVASLVDAGRIRSTATESAGTINAVTLKKVHAKIESNTARGKIVLEGF